MRNIVVLMIFRVIYSVSQVCGTRWLTEAKLNKAAAANIHEEQRRARGHFSEFVITLFLLYFCVLRIFL